MIEELNLRNFKSFRAIDYRPAMLNVFTGLNGPGKSSLIQSLLLLKDIAAQSGTPPWRIGLDGENHAFGTYADLHYAYSQSEDDTIVIRVRTDHDAVPYSFSMADAESDADDVTVSFMRDPDVAASDAHEDSCVRLMQELRSIQYISAFRLPPMQEHKYSAKNVAIGGKDAILQNEKALKKHKIRRIRWKRN